MAGKELKLKRKILLIVLAVCTVFSIVSAETLIAADIDHDCTDHACQICIKLETVKNFLKTIKLLSIISLSIASFAVYICIQKNISNLITYNLTPVMLKVRMNS